MRIIWTKFASEMLKEVHDFYAEVAGKKLAVKILQDIFDKTELLLKHPEAGQIEESLSKLKEGHRYLISGHNKIIYKKVNGVILITDVFDTRQDPSKINDPKRKNN